MEDLTQSANHSAEPEIIDSPVEQAAPAQQETAPTAPEGIRVKFNKEERLIGLDEAPAYIQKGLNYDKVQEKATQYEQNMLRTAKFYGFDNVEDYVAALDQAEQDRLIQQEAERYEQYGVSEDFIRSELQPLRGELAQVKAEREALQRERMEVQVNRELTEARTKYPDFDNYGDTVFEMVTQRGYSIEHAYMVASYQDKLTHATKQAEAETIRKLQQNAESSPGALGQGDVEHQTGFASLSKAERRKFREEVKQGRRNSF
jgi:hypothetical protein